MQGRTPGYSTVIKTEVVCPNDTNPLAILQGGRLVEWMDMAAAVCAQNHAGKVCVTAFIDKVSFRHPAKVGDVILVKAMITRAFTTSMEIMVEAHSKKIASDEKQLISQAYFTFVALDETAKASPIPAVLPQTQDELVRYEEAMKRKMEKHTTGK